jgi:multimeric flavodoxin WrbA
LINLHVQEGFMSLTVTGISGSPIRNGHTDMFLEYVMQYSKNYDSDTQTIFLSETHIKDCIHCNYCLSKQTQHDYCSLKDDGQTVFERIEQSDILILASPVYFMRASARMAAMMDRLRVFVYGNVVGGRMKNKVGMSAAVGWARNGGIETTHLSHLYTFMTLEMIPVSAHKCVSPIGASFVTGPKSKTEQKDQNSLVKIDKAGLHSAQTLFDRAANLANLLNKNA